jgi:hypothetical protein
MDLMTLAIAFVAIAGPPSSPSCSIGGTTRTVACPGDAQPTPTQSTSGVRVGSGCSSCGWGRQRRRQRGRRRRWFQLIASSRRGSNPVRCCSALRVRSGSRCCATNLTVSWWPPVPGRGRLQRCGRHREGPHHLTGRRSPTGQPLEWPQCDATGTSTRGLGPGRTHCRSYRRRGRVPRPRGECRCRA